MGSEDFRKITWIKWDTIYLKKEVGGLGVWITKDFNAALLGKWCWRMREERDLLWYKVLVARYGEIGGRIVVGGRLD